LMITSPNTPAASKWLALLFSTNIVNDGTRRRRQPWVLSSTVHPHTQQKRLLTAAVHRLTTTSESPASYYARTTPMARRSPANRIYLLLPLLQVETRLESSPQPVEDIPHEFQLLQEALQSC
jgi:hypothetical protein